MAGFSGTINAFAALTGYLFIGRTDALSQLNQDWHGSLIEYKKQNHDCLRTTF
jgi:hypothetical protein